MNANKLADDMENGRFNDINYNKKKAADFVRQQQAEIEALKLQLHTTLTNRNLEKPTKYSDAWWKEAAEFNKARKAQKE
jgi:hypothetical protein